MDMKKCPNRSKIYTKLSNNACDELTDISNKRKLARRCGIHQERGQSRPSTKITSINCVPIYTPEKKENVPWRYLSARYGTLKCRVPLVDIGGTHPKLTPAKKPPSKCVSAKHAPSKYSFLIDLPAASWLNPPPKHINRKGTSKKGPSEGNLLEY